MAGFDIVDLQKKQYKFSVAKPSDISDLVHLVNSAYRGESSRAGWTTEADLLGGQRIDAEGLMQVLTQSQKVILCLRSRLIGETGSTQLLACVELTSLDESAVLLGMLSVAPEHQNQGFGAKLISHAESFALETFGASVMAMKVISVRSELIAYYERKGYVVQQKYEPFPYGNERFGIPKRNDLQFVLLEKTL